MVWNFTINCSKEEVGILLFFFKSISVLCRPLNLENVPEKVTGTSMQVTQSWSWQNNNLQQCLYNSWLLFIMWKGCVFWPVFSCAHIVYFHQLSGARPNICHSITSWNRVASISRILLQVTHYIINFVEGLCISTSFQVLSKHRYLITINQM